MGAAVACQLGDQVVGGRHQPRLIALARHFHPPALQAMVVAPAENAPVRVLANSATRKPPRYSTLSSQRQLLPINNSASCDRYVRQ